MSELVSRPQENRSASAFRYRSEQKKYWFLLMLFIGLGFLASYGLLVYNNPVAIDSPSFIPVVRRRISALVAMLIAATCQSLATVAFQTLTNNRIITPSLLGFEALYATIQTSTIFFLGAATFLQFTGLKAFIIQVILMVLMCLVLYGWLLMGKFADLQLMLLVGVILGTGLRALSSFMRRMLAPSEFDILQARLFGSVNNADPAYFPIAIPIVLVAACLLIAASNKLNVIALGKNISTSFGMHHRLVLVINLIWVSILMAVSTALIGPLTFFGFLVATLTYQIVPTYDHKYIFPMALAIGFLIITNAYFFMYHVFNAQGVVSIIIELFGGLAFLVVILRKGAL